MLRLDFSYEDLSLPVQRDMTRRASISGVQDKVQLKRTGNRFFLVESGGDYILKPVPRNTSAVLADDIPANEVLTMDMDAGLFGICTAEHAFVSLADGSPAYLRISSNWPLVLALIGKRFRTRSPHTRRT